MITVDIKRLINSIKKSQAYTLPNMNIGTEYLYNTIYKPLSNGTTVNLSDIDFECFELEDTDTLCEFYTDIFEKNSYIAYGLINTVKKINPIYKPISFV